MQCDVVCLNSEKIESIQRELPSREQLQEKARFYKAIGHPVRLAILEVLTMEECCVCDLANVLREPVSTISQHLKMLRELKLLSSRREGKLVFYSFADPLKLNPLYNSPQLQDHRSSYHA